MNSGIQSESCLDFVLMAADVKTSAIYQTKVKQTYSHTCLIEFLQPWGHLGLDSGDTT